MRSIPLLAGCSLLLVLAGLIAGAAVLLLLAWLGRRQSTTTTTAVTMPVALPSAPPVSARARSAGTVSAAAANATAASAAPDHPPSMAPATPAVAASHAPASPAATARDVRPPPSPAASPHPAGSIVWTGGPLAGKVQRVPPEGLWIGREPPAQVVVAEDEVSRLHCWVGPRDGAVVLVDDGSSNGTLVMGERVGRRALRHGDVVVLARGAASFRYERAGGG